MAPKDIFVTDVFLKLDKSVQNKLHKCMKKKRRSRRSRVIDRKQKGYRWTDRPTYRHVQSNMPPLLQKGGHNDINRQQLICLRHYKVTY